jgi:hypothetical protein
VTHSLAPIARCARLHKRLAWHPMVVRSFVAALSACVTAMRMNERVELGTRLRVDLSITSNSA